MIEVVDVRKSYRSGDRWVEALRGRHLPDRQGAVRVHRRARRGRARARCCTCWGRSTGPTSGTILVEGQRPDGDDRGRAERLPPRQGRLHLPVVQPDQQPDGASRTCWCPFLPRGVTAEQKQRAAELLTRGRPGRPARPPPLPAVRRRAAAGGDRPGPDQGPGPRPGRRADRRARLQDRRRDLPDPPPSSRTSGRRRWWSSPTTAGSSRPTTSSSRSRTARSLETGRRTSPRAATAWRRGGRRSDRGSRQSRRMTLPKPDWIPAALGRPDLLEREDRSTTGRTSPRSSQGTTRLGEQPGGGDLLLERPGPERRADHGEPLPQHQPRGRASPCRRRAGRPGRAARARRQRTRGCPPAPWRRQVEHHVDPRAARVPVGRPRRNRRCVVSMPTSSPRRPRLLELVGGPRGAEDGAAHRVRDLDGRRAHAAADGVDQHPLARPQPALGHQGVVRGEEDLGDGRGLLEVEVRRGSARPSARGSRRTRPGPRRRRSRRRGRRP